MTSHIQLLAFSSTTMVARGTGGVALRPHEDLPYFFDAKIYILLWILNQREVIREVLEQHLPSIEPDNHRLSKRVLYYGRLK